MKIWAKTMRGDKILQDTIYSRDEKYKNSGFMNYLVDICHGFDIPTPMVLKSHKHNFEKFNITKFKEADFIETVYFDYLVLESVME